jgi:hypothetical protein
MRKSRRQRNIKKRNKSRKFRGGNSDNSGYVLAGFTGNSVSPYNRIPRYLLKEKTLKKNLPAGFESRDFSKSFLISVLYDLNFRGLNFITIQGPDYSRNPIYFYDGEELIYPPRSGAFGWGTSGLIVNMNKADQTKIKEIELKYPGLFTRMFITEEEEKKALEQIQQKERLKTEAETEIDNLFSQI